MARMPDVTIGFDPESRAALDRFSAAVERLNADLAPPMEAGLRCDECGVTLMRPETSEPTASTFWAAGDLCPFTKECMGLLQDTDANEGRVETDAGAFAFWDNPTDAVYDKL